MQLSEKKNSTVEVVIGFLALEILGVVLLRQVGRLRHVEELLEDAFPDTAKDLGE